MKEVKYSLSLIIITLFLYGCGEDIPGLKKFLIDHTEVSFQINSRGKIYNKYSDYIQLIRVRPKCELLTVFVGNKSHEFYLTGDEQKVPNTSYVIGLRGFP